MATKITLRTKSISGNRESLYLDFYPAIPNPKTGEPTRREFLGLYLHSPIKQLKRKDKLIPVYDNNPIMNNEFLQHNEETIIKGEQIRRERENQLGKPEIYSGYEKEQLRLKEMGERNFVDYFKQLKDKRKKTSHDNWVSAYYYLESYTNGKLRFADLSEKFCNDFKEHLIKAPNRRSPTKTLSHNSAVAYFNMFKATLSQAFKDGDLPIDLSRKISPIKSVETHRSFLTLEELNDLVKAPCKDSLLKRAALFSALTGLRHCDIINLVWGEVEYIKGNGYFIQFKQQKTGGAEMMPISDQAYKLLGERKEPGDKIFAGLTYSAYYNKQLYQWIGAAGITKDITFHCFRHTFATLQLSSGTDIYTVSKMLGHRDMRQTQIYAKIINMTKREAANRIKIKL